MTQSVVPAAGDRWIYHFTHVDDLGAIRAAGLLRCDAVAREGMTRIEVGDPDIKESRRRRSIPIEPGGRVGDYVPFYFAPRSPMATTEFTSDLNDVARMVDWPLMKAER